MKKAVFLTLLLLAFACETRPPQEMPAPVRQKPAKPVESAEVKPSPGDKVRPMRAAGSYYPADAGTLRNMVESYISSAGKIEVPNRPLALIAPHAGYVFSGPVAGFSYATVKGLSYDTVVVIGSHTRDRLASVLDLDYYQTPLGYVKVDRDVVKKLLAKPAFNYMPQRHAEHAIEVHVPFLQVALSGNFKIVAIAANYPDPAFVKKVAQDLSEALKGKKVLLIASTDLSHYPPAGKAKEIDGKIMEAWKTLNGGYILKREDALMKEYARVPNLGCVACGGTAVAIVVETSKLLGSTSITLLKYANSGDVPAGNKNEVVGYGAAVITGKEKKEKMEGISKESQQYLLHVAREAIASAVTGKEMPDFEAKSEELKAKRGVFVTLNKKGALRGCIGCFTSDQELPATVARMAVSSATDDPRFAEVAPQEMSEIKIKISILSEPKKVDSAEDVVIGRDGIWVRDPKTGRGGTYLPEVAVELGWDRETFLTDCCLHKVPGGLPGDAWKTGRAEIYTYTTQVFGEEE